MGRVYFSTRNDIGVRTLSGDTLSGDDYVGFRAPAEPAPRGANNPVNLGVYMYDGIGARSEMIRSGPLQNGGPVLPGPPRVYQPLPPTPISSVPGIVSTAPPIASPPVAVGPISSSGGGGQIPVTPIPPAAPVSQQTTPTPQVSVPPAPSGAVLITSGGGTASPAAAPAAGAPASTGGGFVDSIATWLSGSTNIFSYNVPNALLAGIVVLGFAWLEGGGSTGKRR